MKILIGVDTENFYGQTLSLIHRLQFSEATLLLAHSVDVTLPVWTAGMDMQTAYEVDIIRSARESGEQTLERAKERAGEMGLAAETLLVPGGAADSLMTTADENNAELIGVHSNQKGVIASVLLGSVSRALAIQAKQSVLISKGEVADTGPVRIVYAIDLSDYSARALNHFIAMKATGIGEIKVITALHLGEHLQIVNALPTSHLETGAEARIEDHARRTVESAVSKLEEAGYTCTGEVIDAPVEAAIRKAMNDTNADLLVLGAQGHGFVHRLILGSTAQHEVVNEPFSVLIIRPESTDVQ